MARDELGGPKGLAGPDFRAYLGILRRLGCGEGRKQASGAFGFEPGFNQRKEGGDLVLNMPSQRKNGDNFPGRHTMGKKLAPASA